MRLTPFATQQSNMEEQMERDTAGHHSIANWLYCPECGADKFDKNFGCWSCGACVVQPALLGEAATIEKSDGVCLTRDDAEHFAELLDEMIPDLIDDRPKWMYHIGGMKVLRDRLRGDKK
jgi:hypothetical protein